MGNPNYKRAAALLAAMIAIGGCGGSGSSGGSSSGKSGQADTGTNPLQFAVFQPFSGPDAAFGSVVLAGCIPAASAIEAAGGILDHKQVSCKTSDTRGDPADAVPAAEQLISATSGLIGVLGPSSDEAAATVPLFNRARLPMFSETGQALFDKNTFDYFYRITPPDDAVGYAMAVYAHSKGYTRIAGVFGNDISSQGTAPTAAAGFRHLGGTIMMQKIPLDASSYRTEVQQVAAFKPQAIFTEADPQTSATYLAELRQLYHVVPIIGTNGTNNPPWLKAVSGALGASTFAKYYVGAQPYGPTSGPAFQGWGNALSAVVKKLPSPASKWRTDAFSMSFYDAVNLIALAAQEAKSTNPVVFNSYITRVASPSPGAVTVYSFAQGKRALAAGKKIRYVAVVGEITFDQYHNSPGEFEIVKSDGHTPAAIYTAAQVAAAK